MFYFQTEIDLDEEVEEAEEVGVEAAEEVEIGEVVSIKKEIKLTEEKRIKLEANINDKFELDPRIHPTHVESAKLKSICSILNIDCQTFAIKGQSVCNLTFFISKKIYRLS